MKQDNFPINKEKLKNLTAVLYKKSKLFPKESSRTVYVNLSMTRLQMIWVLPKFLFAMGAADKYKANVTAITWGNNSSFEDLLKSLNINHLSLEENDKKNPLAAIKALTKTFIFLIVDGKGTGLQSLRAMDLPVGRAIYEDILRTSNLSTIRSCRNKLCLKKIFHILWMLYSLDSYLKKHPPVFCVLDDIAYHEGILAALFHKHGATIHNQNIVGEGEVLLDDKKYTIRWGERRNIEFHKRIDALGDEVIVEAEQLIKDRLSGKNGRDIDQGAFKNKLVIDRKEAEKKLGLKESKKNIVIMAHTFTDAIYNYGTTCYRDYYDWIESTLKIAEKIDNVNWILKPHPTRKAYHESKDSIEALFERYHKPHMYFLSDDISTESIKDIADVLITIGGNAGAEFACFGIPVIILGKPYYKAFGYTIEPKSKDEYEKLLSSADQISKLDEEQIKIAKKVFYLGNKESKITKYFSDELFQLLRRQDKRMSDEYALQVFEGDKGTERYNDDVMDELSGYFKIHEFKDCEYYQRGLLRAK